MRAVPNSRFHTVSITPSVSADPERYAFIDSKEFENTEIKDTGKYSIFDIADWFLSKDAMTQKKLQKLCYYAQAWGYALKGYRLEDTDYQAWIQGPVSPALWERFKAFGYDTIQMKDKRNTPFEKEDLKLLEDVWDTYGDNTGSALEILTHRELPWIEARKGYGLHEKCTVVISPSTMASYYKSIYCGD